MKEKRDLIYLQQAHVTQTTSEGNKSDWVVSQNETGEQLYKLPREWNEKTIFKVLEFAREFELIALNKGINFGVNQMSDRFEIERKKLLKVIEGLENSNSKLAEKLGKYIGE